VSRKDPSLEVGVFSQVNKRDLAGLDRKASGRFHAAR